MCKFRFPGQHIALWLVSYCVVCVLGISATPSGSILPQLVQRVKPSGTVYVSSKYSEPINQGSGFFLTDNLVVSSRHIFWKESVAQGKVVTHGNDLEFSIKSVIADDANLDIVILEVERTNQTSLVRPLNLSFSPVLEGEDIFVVSSPVGLKGVISTGIISAIHNLYDLQISAPISTGSSGAPIFNYEGEVVGIVTGFFNTGQSLNFGVSVLGLLELIQSIEKRLQKPSTPAPANPPPSLLLPEPSRPSNALPTSNPDEMDLLLTYPTLQQWIEHTHPKEPPSLIFQLFANLKNLTKGLWNQVSLFDHQNNRSQQKAQDLDLPALAEGPSGITPSLEKQKASLESSTSPPHFTQTSLVTDINELRKYIQKVKKEH